MVRRICCIIILFLFVSFPCRSGEERVVLHTPTGDIQGWLLSPEKPADSTVVLIVGGSGPVDHDGNAPGMVNNAYRFLATDLARAGIASLRFDKRGIASSAAAAMSESTLRFEHYIDDVRSWIAFLRKQDRFRRIFLIGHSEGAQIATEVGADDPKIDGVVLIAGMGRSAAEVIHSQLATQLPEEFLQKADAILDSLQIGKQVADVPSLLYSLFRPSVQPYMISWMSHDPICAMARLEMPVLILQGDTDIQVGPEDASLLADANRNARKVTISGMNHVMKPCASTESAHQRATYFDPDLPNHPELASAVISFISDSNL